MHKPPNVAPADENTAPARSKAGGRCRANWEPAFRHFLTVLERASSNGQISLDQVQRLAAAFLKAEGPVAELFSRSEISCRDAFIAADLERKRQDHFGRLIAQPFSDLFGNGAHGLERRQLPQFFTALKMILGDEMYADLRSRAKLIAETYRGEDGGIDWEHFHADRRSVQILDRVRLGVAKSFHRFDPRKDWFLLVMNQNPTTVSLGSNTFVAKTAQEREAHHFTERHMLRLFDALFAGCDPKALSPERKNALTQVGGNDAIDRIGQFRHNVRMALLRLGGNAA